MMDVVIDVFTKESSCSKPRTDLPQTWTDIAMQIKQRRLMFKKKKKLYM